jgi:hypothetical protein
MEKERENIVKMIESEFFCENKTSNTIQTQAEREVGCLFPAQNHLTSTLDESFNKQQGSKSTAENLNELGVANIKSLDYESEEIEFHDSFNQGVSDKRRDNPKKKLFKTNIIDDFSDKEEDYAPCPKHLDRVFGMQESPINTNVESNKMSFHDGSFNYLENLHPADE